MSLSTAELEIHTQNAGRALYLAADGSMYMSRKYAIYKSEDGGRSWRFMTRMNADLTRRFTGWSRLACRALRYEVRSFTVLSAGTMIAANRRWIYWAEPGQSRMTPAKVEQGSDRAHPPMTICVGPAEQIIWGEYNLNNRRTARIRLYASQDRGRSYTVARVFEPGDIRHVHNVLYDPTLRKYWIMAGDYDNESGIGLLSEDLGHLDWVVRGRQIYRAVEAFDLGERLLYATDTEHEPNAIMSLDKSTGRVERLAEIEGSCIYGCRFGNLFAFSTSVEDSLVNHSRDATLLLSRDGESWTTALRARKDWFDDQGFQFGSIVLPRGRGPGETLFFSGQAVSGLDGRALTATWKGSGSPVPTRDAKANAADVAGVNSIAGTIT